jgi:hypothetical protein
VERVPERLAKHTVYGLFYVGGFIVNEADKVQVLVRLTPEMKTWLDAERLSSGRPVTWMINHAITLWRERLEKGRGKTDVAE